MNITIIANGDFPQRKSLLDTLAAADRVVCCDGAFEKYIRWEGKGRQPVAVVGDGDSLSPEVLKEAEAMGIDFVRVKVEEQEYNDLTKSVKYAVKELRSSGSQRGARAVEGVQPDCITILGATGLREDHTLGNISLLAYYMEQYPGIAFRMLTDYGTFLPVRGEAHIAAYKGQQVSIFSLTPDVPVTLKGLKWPVDGRCLTQWWQGTLNEATAETFMVRGGTLLVYLLEV